MTRYLDAAQILFVHARIIETTGGLHGLRDVAMLQSAVARPQATCGGVPLYPDIHAQSGALLQSIVGNHPFVDGNKRTGLAAAGLLLERNGWRLTASNESVEAFALRVAQGHVACDAIVRWLHRHSEPADAAPSR